jgi:hypothetical protein
MAIFEYFLKNFKNNILVKFDPKSSPTIHNNGSSGLIFRIGLDFDPFYLKIKKKCDLYKLKKLAHAKIPGNPEPSLLTIKKFKKGYFQSLIYHF